jgi:hypothetical protein
MASSSRPAGQPGTIDARATPEASRPKPQKDEERLKEVMAEASRIKAQKGTAPSPTVAVRPVQARPPAPNMHAPAAPATAPAARPARATVQATQLRAEPEEHLAPAGIDMESMTSVEMVAESVELSESSLQRLDHALRSLPSDSSKSDSRRKSTPDVRGMMLARDPTSPRDKVPEGIVSPGREKPSEKPPSGVLSPRDAGMQRGEARDAKERKHRRQPSEPDRASLIRKEKAADKGVDGVAVRKEANPKVADKEVGERKSAVQPPPTAGAAEIEDSVPADYDHLKDEELPSLPAIPPPLTQKIAYKNYMRLRYEYQRRGMLEDPSASPVVVKIGTPTASPAGGERLSTKYHPPPPVLIGKAASIAIDSEGSPSSVRKCNPPPPAHLGKGVSLSELDAPNAPEPRHGRVAQEGLELRPRVGLSKTPSSALPDLVKSGTETDAPVTPEMKARQARPPLAKAAPSSQVVQTSSAQENAMKRREEQQSSGSMPLAAPRASAESSKPKPPPRNVVPAPRPGAACLFEFVRLCVS